MKKLCMLAVGLAVLMAMGALLPGRALAQSGPELLLKAIEHYEFAEFEEAEKSLHQALAKPDLTPTLQARAHAYLGLLRLAQGDKAGALKEFGAAKAASPGFKPDPRRFPPKALALYRQASPGAAGGRPTPPPPPAVSKPAKPKPTRKPRPARRRPAKPRLGYVVEVSGKEVTLDMGRKHGVKVGDRFEVFQVKTLVHPVTKKKLHKHIHMAVVKVTEVDQDLSTARIVSRSRPIKVGQRIAKLKAPSPAGGSGGKPAAPGTPAVPAGKGLKVAVLPPVALFVDLPSGLKTSRVARRLSFPPKKGLGWRAWAVSGQKLRQVQSRTGFKADDYLIPPGVTLRGIGSLFSEGDAGGIFEVKLKKKEVRMLRRVMDALGSQALLIWGFQKSVDSDMIQLMITLYRRGENHPAVRDSADMWKSDLREEYPREIVRMLRKGLQKKKR